MFFIADDNDRAEMKKARKLTQALNTIDRCDFEGINAIVRELFGKADESTFLNQPFYCDYGSNIFVGKNCFINYNCTVLDNGQVTLGDNCLLAPNVSIYTAEALSQRMFPIGPLLQEIPARLSEKLPKRIKSIILKIVKSMMKQ